MVFSSRSSWLNRIGTLVIAVCAILVISARFGLGLASPAAAVTLFNWALLLGGFALILGIINALWYHLLRVQRGEREWVFSLLLLIVFALVFGAGVSSPEGSIAPLVEWIFDAVIAPGQATLYALTGFFLLSAAYRYLRFSRPGGMWILAGALLMLLVQTPFFYQQLPVALVDLLDWILNWPVMAAMRGVLLGGTLGVLFIGLRLIANGAK
jgi:hypothetical protein